MKIIPYIIAIAGFAAGVFGYMQYRKIEHEGRFAFSRVYAELIMERSQLFFKSTPPPNNYGIQFEENGPNKIKVSVGVPYELHDDYERWMSEYLEAEIPYSGVLYKAVKQKAMTMNTAFVWEIEVLDI